MILEIFGGCLATPPYLNVLRLIEFVYGIEGYSCPMICHIHYMRLRLNLFLGSAAVSGMFTPLLA